MKLIFFILSGMLLLINSVRSEEVYLNCKFESGTLESTRHSPYRWQKGDIATDDINIIMDIKKKKLINAPHHLTQYDNSTMELKEGKDVFSSSWSDNEIKWDTKTIRTGKLQTHAFMVLNRRSGTLTTRFIHDDGDVSKKKYICSRESKKF